MNELPHGWHWSDFGSICKASQYGINAPSVENGRYPILGMKNMQEGKLDPSDVAFIDLTEEELEKYQLESGDILVNRTNSPDLVGKTALFNLPGIYVFASYLVRFVVDRSVADSRFINYFCNSHPGKHAIQALATKGVSQSNLKGAMSKRLARSMCRQWR